MVSIADTERAALCDLLDELGPDAPTLCEGWTTRDMAVHLYVRDRDPKAWAGISVGRLHGLAEQAMAAQADRPYGEIVAAVRAGAPKWSPMGLPGAKDLVNLLEFVIHHEDVRRAGDSPQTARDLGPEVEEWMWRRLKLLARAWFRRVQVGVVLERLGSAGDGGAPETIRAVPGSSIVTLVGQPSEVMLFAHGRSGAEVKLVGEPDAIDILNAADLSTEL